MTIERFFPNLTTKQKEGFDKMLALYPEWNAKINVISRKDIENLEVQHILHSLAIAKFITFKPGTKIMDLGTGGGFPGIPLALLFPDSEFLLIDRIGKKLKVAQDIAEKVDLKNVRFMHGDIGECHEKFDFVVSRAVMPQGDLLKLIKNNISLTHQKNAVPNGLITLKGGDLSEELRPYARKSEVIDIFQYFPLPFFETKKIVYTQV